MKKAEKIEKIQTSEIIDEKEKSTSGISYDTIGTTLQALNVQLDKGESIYSETGKMSWMTENIEMKTKSRGFSKMVSRVFTGETLFINEFIAQEKAGIVTFSTDQAGKIIPIELKEGRSEVIFQRGAFLCAENGVDLSIALTKRLSAGLFGGIGFILQKVTGKGMAHLIADGEVVVYELKDKEELFVDQGNLVAYEPSVDFDIKTVSGGLFNWLFGGEGVFHGKLKGPGKVWLQTRKMTISSAAAGKASYNRTKSSSNPIGCLIGLAISGCFGLFVLITILASLRA